MRLRTFAGLLALAGAACSNSVTDPFYAATNPMLSGLSAYFRSPSAADAFPGGLPSVRGAGDSVAVVATGAGASCGIRTARAGISDGLLVVTRFDSIPPGGLICLAIARGPEPFKIVVRPVPSGRYTVVLRDRFQTQAGVADFRERELVRGSVTLR